MSDKLLNVEIVSPQQQVFQGKATIVDVPGKLSPFQILYNHAPIFSTLDCGIVRVVDQDNKNNYFAINTGFVEVSNNNISIVVEEVASIDEINPEKINAEIISLKNELNNNPLDKETILNRIKFNETKLKIITFEK